MVEELARAGTRPTTVLLGARSDADHYDLDAVRALVERYARLEVVLAAPADGAAAPRRWRCCTRASAGSATARAGTCC
ncbi:hypothetical protein ACFQ1I_22465 [Kitasatospora arboriphila]